MFRGLALAATAVLSQFHWNRGTYQEYSRWWQFGLAAIDPRVAAALEWSLLHSAWLGWVLIPLALVWSRWELQGWRQSAERLMMAGLLGSRGVAASVLVQQFCRGSLSLDPARFTILETVAGARAAVLVAEACWLLPLLVLAARRWPHQFSRPATAWLGAGYAWLEPGMESYLVCDGGPNYAAGSLGFLAFREGFGRQELGYAAVLTLITSFLALPLGCWVGRQIAPIHPTPEPGIRATHLKSVTFAATIFMGLCLPRQAWSGLVGSLLLTVLAGGFALGLTKWSGRIHPVDGATACLPVMVWVLPLVWIAAKLREPWIQGLLPMLGLVAAPWAWLVAARLRATSGAFLAAWWVWTDALTPLMLGPEDRPALLLPAWTVWEMSGHLESNLLRTPGWWVVWFGGSVLAYAWIRGLGEIPFAEEEKS